MALNWRLTRQVPSPFTSQLQGPAGAIIFGCAPNPALDVRTFLEIRYDGSFRRYSYRILIGAFVGFNDYCFHMISPKS